MICPHCDHDVELTWDRYWNSPFGRHTCPHCDEAFQLKNSRQYVSARVLIWTFFGLLPAWLVLWFGGGVFQALAAFVILGLIFGIPIDKKIDDTWRGTRPIDATKPDGPAAD